MPGLISVPSSSLFENKENIGSQMEHANKKNIEKKSFFWKPIFPFPHPRKKAGQIY